MGVFLVVDGRRTQAERGRTLFECAAELGVRIPTSCRGQGKCRECLVEVSEGADALGERSDEELALAEGFRLSCRARIEGEDGVVRCATLRRGRLRIEESGAPRADAGDGVRTPPVRSGPDGVWRDGACIEPVHGPALGLALDVGTTTVVLRLHDLDTGGALATHSFENPQRFGGSDVMARIRFDAENPGRLLRRTLVGYLAHAIDELPCDPRRIFEVVAVGNTTMRDLLLGLDVSGVGEFPYRSTTEAALRAGELETTGRTVAARSLGLRLHPRALVHALPLVGGHVGADTAAGLLATGVGTGRGVRVLMDIGTNTEVVVGNAERLLAASCPAGPAFEGGRVRCGMPALDGAIERVALGEDGAVRLEVVGGGAPAGVCGSGLVDVLGELLRTGRMNERGRLGEEGRAFVLDAERGIDLGEHDVNELAQAKGANAAGLRAVLDLYGPEARSIERFCLAGGFARHLDLGAARRIGLVPDLADAVFERSGNAALEGAALALTSLERRREIEELVLRIEHVSLETHPRFFDFFVEGCQFAPFAP